MHNQNSFSLLRGRQLGVGGGCMSKHPPFPLTPSGCTLYIFATVIIVLSVHAKTLCLKVVTAINKPYALRMKMFRDRKSEVHN